MKWKWKIEKQGRNFKVADSKHTLVLTPYFLKQLYPLFKNNADYQEINDQIFSLLKDRLLYFLTLRDRSEKEIERYLIRLHLGEFYPKAQSWLKKLNLLDDRKFAQKLINWRKEAGFGPFYIKQQLWQKGIDADLVEALLKKSYTEKEEKKIISEVFSKYQRKVDLKNAKDRAKAIRYLAGRGFKQHI
ncbi:MAG: RecX family transcriptional regulator, partial [Patescibacteria group bacterium]|nr:RecX family transcriptional regulator [Patescibacteria group bacterium]